jgi:hypothetical protein
MAAQLLKLANDCWKATSVVVLETRKHTSPLIGIGSRPSCFFRPGQIEEIKRTVEGDANRLGFS